MKLTVELVPETCHFSNLRSNLAKQDWDKLRRECYKRFDYRCSVCDGVGRDHPVEAHEVWHYDDETRIQKLMDVVALCPDCHKVKHLGLAQIRGWYGESKKHLQKVNELTVLETERYISSCFEEYARRSGVCWKLDIGWLKSRGVKIPDDLDRLTG